MLSSCDKVFNASVCFLYSVVVSAQFCLHSIHWQMWISLMSGRDEMFDVSPKQGWKQMRFLSSTRSVQRCPRRYVSRRQMAQTFTSCSHVISLVERPCCDLQIRVLYRVSSSPSASALEVVRSQRITYLRSFGRRMRAYQEFFLVFSS